MPGGFPGYGSLDSHAVICGGLAFGFFRRPNSNKGGGLAVAFAFFSKVVVGGPRCGCQGRSEIKAPPVFNPKGSVFQRATFSKYCCNVRAGTRNGPATDFGFVGVGCFIDAKIRVFLLRILMRYCSFFFRFCVCGVTQQLTCRTKYMYVSLHNYNMYMIILDCELALETWCVDLCVMI